MDKQVITVTQLNTFVKDYIDALPPRRQVNVKGVYLYWDFEKDSMLNTPFYLDELQLVDDYTVFEKYGN